jgi:3-keto-L-gulonate-6-phosphate decarboxylase
MDHKKTPNHSGHLNRRSFLGDAGRLVGGGLAVGAIFDSVRPPSARGQQPAQETHPSSALVVDRFKTRLSFQISVDVGTLDLGLTIASAALTAGVDIVEMGTPLLKTQGTSNVVPAFRKQFPEALLLADMKTMDGGGGEARSVYAGGGNIVDFLALAGVDTAKSICAVRDEFRRVGKELPRLAFADIMLPHQGTRGPGDVAQADKGAQAGEVALRMVEAGVDAVGIHLQADARRANPKLIEDDYLGDVARAVFERIGKAVPVQVVGGLSIAQAKRLAQAGLRAFVISGNLGLPDGNARYNLPPAEIQRLVADFIAEVSGR